MAHVNKLGVALGGNVPFVIFPLSNGSRAGLSSLSPTGSMLLLNISHWEGPSGCIKHAAEEAHG